MNTNAHIEEADQPPMPARLRGLWGEACAWVGWLLNMFDRDALRATGLKRATGARLNIWLMNIEGALRRLVLAAALAFTPTAPRKAPACAAARVLPTASSVRRPGFCVFRLGGAGEARAATPPAAPSRPYGHILFPSDPLLRLGPAHPPAPRHTRGARQRNPLDRWGRLSRRDPDWRPPEGETSFGDALPPCPRQRQDAPRAHRARDPAALPESLHDWRRHHDEWERLVPAPQLAARLEALAHLMAHPDAVIARAARRLRHARASSVRETGAMPGTPRRAAHIATMGHTQAFATRCHEALVSPDTS